MTSKTLLKLLAAGLLLASESGHAAYYHVAIQIDPALYGTLNAPLFLDFQLNSGGGAVANSATIDHFSFTGGGATPNTITASGAVSGDLSSSVALADDATNPYNEFFQGFANGTTAISFDVLTTSNANAPTPDSFAVALLDSSLGNLQLPSSAPDGVSLFTVSIGDSNPGSSYAGVGSASGITTSFVPSPATLWLFAPGLAGLRLFGKRRAA